MEHNSHNRGNLRKLTTQLTPFIGREKELAEISSLLSDADCRLLSLIGPGGIGRELLRRAFPEGGERKSIIATTDIRAQALYLKVGVYPRFPLYFFARQPEHVTVNSDLVIEPIRVSPQPLQILADLDKNLLGFSRDSDHCWLLTDWGGYLYYRDGQLWLPGGSQRALRPARGR